ncbi:unnamed protein product [Rotaria sp. Silwood2]|nr:unnamed protein product [Rotaria sp. Silwood2]
MVDRRLLFVFIVVVLFVSVLHAERARYDNLQDEEQEIDSLNDNNYEEDLIETVKRFLGMKKKTTTPKPSSDAIIALFSATPSTGTTSATKSSIYDDKYGRKTSSSTTPRYGRYSSTSRYDRTTKSPGKDACGFTSPCEHGGTCKTLSSGRYYCFCTQDYYGKNCEHKFSSSGSSNDDRRRKDHCASSPCRNSGECVGLRTTYYCRCKTPYYGTNCDKRISKREEFVDESSASEQDLQEYKRDLQEDTEDLRRAIANENMLENIE